MLETALHLARTIHNAGPPADNTAGIHPAVAVLARRMLGILARERSPGRGEEILLHLRARDTFAHRVRYLRRLIFVPSHGDRQALGSDKPFILYWIFRPFRLATSLLRGRRTH